MGGAKSRGETGSAFRKILDAKMEILVTAAGCIGLVGQFVMGNDPGFHIPYLYNYLDLPGRRRNESVLLDTFLPTT